MVCRLLSRSPECRAKFLQSMANTSAVSGSSLLHGQSRSKHSKRSCTDRTARFHSRQVLTVKTLMNQGMNSNIDPNSDLRSLILTTNGFWTLHPEIVTHRERNNKICVCEDLPLPPLFSNLREQTLYQAVTSSGWTNDDWLWNPSPLVC